MATGLALLISADAGSLVGLSQVQTGQLVPLLVLLIVFAGGLFTRRQRFSEILGNLFLWLGIFSVALVSYAFRDELQMVAGRVFSELAPTAAVIDAERGTATFRSGRNGHFQLETSVNGAPVTMLFDTGASAVVLSIEDAEAAGIDTGGLRFDIPVQTANGTGRAANVVLETLEVGGIRRDRVRAFVAEASALDTSLLGMTFLRTLSRYAVSQNSLELVD
ncbi:TIGR02281 family clan AA aspartic protease [Arsenicitalea aurantiaca]|uniref:TIGR02281 family clan AA aspartic protease n=1 Tax=Arsenicitalea aurantiaca TaxID=1783274 RepID=A0A433XA73_9HYPH|nr:TIGR02281 family clan AA aspartic protease [Arsenicitalea aurantiaca]RUT30954.1 TIGR02281 family clan AA aspartic protease [Arsenicitalea aurantiaca]